MQPYDAAMPARDRMPNERPASVLLVHGAGSGPWVYDGWAENFPGVRVSAVDLQDKLDVAVASHDDYAHGVLTAAASVPAPVALCGWSMGGLVVLQTAQLMRPHRVVLLEASAPAEVQGFNPDTEIAGGSFDPEAVYGRFTDGMAPRPESSRARAERNAASQSPAFRAPRLSSTATISAANAAPNSPASTALTSATSRALTTGTLSGGQRFPRRWPSGSASDHRELHRHARGPRSQSARVDVLKTLLRSVDEDAGRSQSQQFRPSWVAKWLTAGNAVRLTWARLPA
jgi:pimeloyl-ACP methyl ester carboxylesterase